jgi:4-alpha-glucanotransferase
VGPAAVAWVDRPFTSATTLVAGTALGPTGYGDSPYQPLSSFAGNALLISPDWLIEDGLVRAADCADRSFSPTIVDFDAVKRFKYALLAAGMEELRCRRAIGPALGLRALGHDHAHWLDDYALFRALKERYDGAGYLEWPEDLVRRRPSALEKARGELASQVDLVRFSQFLLFRQGARLKAHARAKGVRLIGDLPFFVSPDSSDVWANRTCFCSTRSTARASWPGCRRTISARKDSGGAIRSMTGMR